MIPPILAVNTVATISSVASSVMNHGSPQENSSPELEAAINNGINVVQLQMMNSLIQQIMASKD